MRYSDTIKIGDIGGQKQKKKNHMTYLFSLSEFWSEKAKIMCPNLKRWELLLSYSTPSLFLVISHFLAAANFSLLEWEFKILFDIIIVFVAMILKNYFIKNIFDWNWFDIYVYLVKSVVEIEVEQKVV
jgi:hypothetical protein